MSDEVATLRVLGREIEVRLIDRRSTGDMGQVLVDHGVIAIRQGSKPEREVEALLHELLHFVADQLLPEKDQPTELQINVLAAGLFDAIVMNEIDFGRLLRLGVQGLNPPDGRNAWTPSAAGDSGFYRKSFTTEVTENTERRTRH